MSKIEPSVIKPQNEIMPRTVPTDQSKFKVDGNHPDRSRRIENDPKLKKRKRLRPRKLLKRVIKHLKRYRIGTKHAARPDQAARSDQAARHEYVVQLEQVDVDTDAIEPIALEKSKLEKIQSTIKKVGKKIKSKAKKKMSGNIFESTLKKMSKSKINHGRVYPQQGQDLENAKAGRPQEMSGLQREHRVIRKFIADEPTLNVFLRNENVQSAIKNKAVMPLEKFDQDINACVISDLRQHYSDDDVSAGFDQLTAVKNLEEIKKTFPEFRWGSEIKTLEDTKSFLHQLEQSQGHMAEIAAKIEDGSASDGECAEFSQLLHDHRINLAIAQTHIGNTFTEHLQRGQEAQIAMKPEIPVLLQAMSERLAVHHMVIADLLSKYGAALPPHTQMNHPTYQLNRELREAQGLLIALDLKQNYDLTDHDDQITSAIRRLKVHCEKLEARFDAHKKAAIGRDDGQVPLSQKLAKSGQAPENRLDFNLALEPAKMPSARLMAEGRRRAINQASWPVIENNISVMVEDKMHNYVSETKPGGSGPAPSFAYTYQGGIATPGQTEFYHTPNLAQSGLHTDDGRVLFQSVRHAALNPSGITPAFLREMPFKEREELLDNMYWNEGLKTKSAPNLKAFSFEVSVGDDATLQPICATIQKNVRENMAREVITATLFADQEKYNQALELSTLEDKYDPETHAEFVTVSVNAISLMTPVPSTSAPPTRERAILAAQLGALQAVSNQGKPFLLPIRDQQSIVRFVPVKVELRQFNFGVESAPLRWRGIPLQNIPLPKALIRHVTGWGYSTKLNDPALTDLVGDPKSDALGGVVGTKLKSLEEKLHILQEQHQRFLEIGHRLSLSLPPESASTLYGLEQEIKEISQQGDLIIQCAFQVKNIWHKGEFRSQHGEPHKLVSRLALLCSAIGQPPSISDINGLDRVSRCDADAKYLAAMVDSTGQLPTPDDKTETSAATSQRARFMQLSGDAELRRYNDGLTG